MTWPKPLGIRLCKTESPALVLLKADGTRIEYSWEQYNTKSLQSLHTLKTEGVMPGDFIAVIATNLPESFFVMSAIIMAGAIIVPINFPVVKEPGYNELKSILKDCQPKLVATNECLIKYLLGSGIGCMSFEDIINLGEGETEQVTSFVNDIQEDKLMVMPYTSGTTGNPKGVMLNYKNISNRVKAVSRVFGITQKERLLSYLPLGHISELVATFFGQLDNGYTVYFTEHIKEITENRENFRKAFPKILADVKPTIFLAVPKIWSNLRIGVEKQIKPIPNFLFQISFIKNFVANRIKSKLGLDNTRFFISASARLFPEDKKFFAGLGININDIYGQTETAGPIIMDGQIIGDANVFAGEDSEITVAGNCVMMGYYKIDKTFVNGYGTGDRGSWQSGRVLFQGRIKDGFKLSQGEFVSEAKIELLENEIRKIDGVQEVIVCCESKPYMVALIFSPDHQSGYLKEDIQKALTLISEGIYKVKKFILLNPSQLELTSTLKIKRSKIIQKFQQQIDQL